MQTWPPGKFLCINSAKVNALRSVSSRTSPLTEAHNEMVPGQDRFSYSCFCSLVDAKTSLLHCNQSVWATVGGRVGGPAAWPYLSLSSAGTGTVWPTTACASSRSRRSWWAEAAEGCWSPPVGGPHSEKSRHIRHAALQIHTACAWTCLYRRCTEQLWTHRNKTYILFVIHFFAHAHIFMC